MDIIENLKKLVGIDENDLYSHLALIAPIVLCYLLFPDNFPDNDVISVLYIVFFVAIFQLIYKIPISKKLGIKQKMIDNITKPFIDTKPRFEETRLDLINLRTHCANISVKFEASHSVFDLIIQSIDKKIKQTDDTIKLMDDISENYNYFDPEEMYKKTVENNQRIMVYVLFITSFVFWVLEILPFSSDFNIFIIYNMVGFVILFFVFIILLITSYYVSYMKYKFLKNIALGLHPLATYFLRNPIQKKEKQD